VLLTSFDATGVVGVEKAELLAPASHDGEYCDTETLNPASHNIGK
jgi:hypothetical protein